MINEENSCTYFIKLFWPSDVRIHVFLTWCPLCEPLDRSRVFLVAVVINRSSHLAPLPGANLVNAGPFVEGRLSFGKKCIDHTDEELGVSPSQERPLTAHESWGARVCKPAEVYPCGLL